MIYRMKITLERWFLFRNCFRLDCLSHLLGSITFIVVRSLDDETSVDFKILICDDGVVDARRRLCTGAG